MRKRMLQLKALPAVGISVLPKPILRSSASAGDPTRVVSSSSRAGAALSSPRPQWPPRSTPLPTCSHLGSGLFRFAWTAWTPALPRLRARWTTKTTRTLLPTPAPPAPPTILWLLLRATDCAKQPLDSLLHLLPNHVADHSDQT